MSYYNTTHVVGSQKAQYQSQAAAQEVYILKFFKARPAQLFTPSDVLDYLVTVLGSTAPITSVRRAITNLTSAGALLKTKHQKTGPYNRPEYCWMYNNPANSGDDLINKLCGRN